MLQLCMRIVYRYASTLKLNVSVDHSHTIVFVSSNWHRSICGFGVATEVYCLNFN